MKKIISSVILLLALIIPTGCIKRDNMEGIDIYTTVYPIEYITNYLYGEHSNVHSIYPVGIIVDEYKLTDKQIKDYSKGDLFIFNGLAVEKDYVSPMFKNNKDLLIIDTTLTMEHDYGIEELWLNPSNFLMMTQNIKKGLDEYIDNHYLKNQIEEKYQELKIAVSNMDAKLKLLSEKSTSKKIVVSSDLFKYLTKYDIEVLSLEENSSLTEKTISTVTDLIKSKEINFIFVKPNEELNDTIKKIVADTKVEVVTLHTLSNISETELNNNNDYISIMNQNIELLKNELYD